MEDLASVPNTDDARPLLETICHAVKNTFDREQIDLAQQLITLAYSGKVLQKDTCQQFLQFIAAEKENLQDDVTIKDILQKTWYTLAYQEAPGRIKYVTNARQAWIYHKKSALEEQGRIVAPIFQRTYWYNNQTTPEAVKALHQAYCQTLLDAAYLQTWRPSSVIPPPWRQNPSTPPAPPSKSSTALRLRQRWLSMAAAGMYDAKQSKAAHRSNDALCFL